jgi:hypothetical protein
LRCGPTACPSGGLRVGMNNSGFQVDGTSLASTVDRLRAANVPAEAVLRDVPRSDPDAGTSAPLVAQAVDGVVVALAGLISDVYDTVDRIDECRVDYGVMDTQGADLFRNLGVCQ